MEIRETPIAEFHNRGAKFYVDDSEVNADPRDRPHFHTKLAAQDWIDTLEYWAAFAEPEIKERAKCTHCGRECDGIEDTGFDEDCLCGECETAVQSHIEKTSC